jgi:hypothetical protein
MFEDALGRYLTELTQLRWTKDSEASIRDTFLLSSRIPSAPQIHPSSIRRAKFVAKLMELTQGPLIV